MRIDRLLSSSFAFPAGLRLLLLVLVCGAPTALAQVEHGGTCSDAQPRATHELSGVISDGSGGGLSGAVVKGRCGVFTVQTRTLADGEYRLLVPVGTVSLEITAEGFTSTTREIAVAPDSPGAVLNAQLSVADVRSSVEVFDHAPYLEDQTISGTKTELPLLEVPQAITIVSRRLLDEQGAVKLDDALKNVAGVMPGGYYDGWDYYRIRGFDASFNTYLDGLRGGNGTSDETWGLESVEVLKGPSSALYGQSVLGGLVNLQSKRPRPDAFANLEFTTGSFGFVSPAVDFGGSLNRSKSLFGRLVILHRRQDSFVDYAYLRRTYVAPSLTWRIAPSTSFTILSRYQLDNGRHAFPLPAQGTVLPNINGEIPISRYIGETTDGTNGVHEDNRHIGYQLSHRFSDNLGFRQTFRYTFYRQDWNHLLYPLSLASDQRTLYRYPLDYYQRWQNYAVDSAVDWKTNTGSVRHDLLLGYDFFRNPNSFTGYSIDFSDPTQLMPIDVFKPVYGAAKFPSTLVPAYGGTSITQFQGLYLQDHAKITKRLAITGGGRFNFSKNRDLPGPSNDQYAFTPRIGGTYQLFNGGSLYASYSRSYLPQSGRLYDSVDANGKFAPPETGQQWEAGFKTSLLGSRLSTTLALFNLERRNLLTTDPTHPNFYILTGRQRSRGVEFEAAYLIRSGWSLTTAYAFTDARVTEDNSIPVGTRTQNAPRHTFSTWMRYEFQRGLAKGLAFGAGGRYYTDQAADLNDTFRLGSYGIADASVSYRVKRVSVQLNGYNLTNTRYFTGSYDMVYVKPGPPRSARVTIGYRF